MHDHADCVQVIHVCFTFRTYARASIACGSMVLFFFCRLFVRPAGRTNNLQGAKPQPQLPSPNPQLPARYLPGWRGGRRESGAPRTICCLNPPDFALDLGDLPPDWLFFDIRSSSVLLGLPGHSKRPIRHHPLTDTASQEESKSRERLRVAHGPCIACLGKLPWRHTNRKRDHHHHPNANDRNGAVHDHGVAQVGHRRASSNWFGYQR